MFDRAVATFVHDAIMAEDPHVAEALNEDARHESALEAVEQAQEDLRVYRDSIEIQRELGPSAFAQGLKVRKEAVETARAELRQTPRPKAPKDVKKFAGVLPLKQVLAEVRVFPRSNSDARVTVTFRGAAAQVLRTV